MAKTYDELTTNEKADFIAYCLNFGIVDYFDSCHKEKDGTYAYYNAENEEITRFTAEELVEDLEREMGEDIRNEYESRMN